MPITTLPNYIISGIILAVMHSIVHSLRLKVVAHVVVYTCSYLSFLRYDDTMLTAAFLSIVVHFTYPSLPSSYGAIINIFNLYYYFSSVLLRVRDILLLIDIGFVETISNYFKMIFADARLPQRQQGGQPGALMGLEEGVFKEEEQKDRRKGKETKKKLAIPTIKVDANIQDVRVALIETPETSEPQALILKVS